jgi:hypothetical protein
VAKTPIEMILDGVEWVAAEGDAPTNGANDLPYATHSGVLQIGEHSLKCFRLSDGQSVFDAEDFERFFDGMANIDHAINGDEQK